MKKAYPIVLTPAEEGGYIVYVPDFDVSTQGDDEAEAMYMARDVIEAMGCYREDEKQGIPEASSLNTIYASGDQIKTLVDVDFAAYRKRMDNRSVRKNCTIPKWLSEEAERAGINFSATLQEALKSQLGVL